MNFETKFIKCRVGLHILSEHLNNVACACKLKGPTSLEELIAPDHPVRMKEISNFI